MSSYTPYTAIRGRLSMRFHSIRAVANITIFVGLAAMFFVSDVLAIGQCNNKPAPGQPVIGLALGGGGARGFAHVGVLRYLEDHRIPYHRIAGTSMGSIAGGLAATGMTADEISEFVQNINWSDMFSDKTERQLLPARRKNDDLVGLYGPKLGIGKDQSLLPNGFVAGQKILFMFESITTSRMQVNHFDDLAVPYRAVATDIVTGEMVVLEDGSLAQSMRASMSVPGAFDPAPLDEHLLVDGGLVRNLPVDIVRNLGADHVIAVNVGTPLRTANEISNALTVIEQMTSLAIVANTQAQIDALEPTDVLVAPALGNDITSSSFDRFSEAFTLGYAAAMDQAEALSVFSVSEEEYANWKSTVQNCIQGAPVIQFVHLNNQSRFSDDVINELINIEPGSTLDTQQIDEDLRQVYGLGFIRIASYTIKEEDGKTGIEIQVLPDVRGTDLLETGLTITGGDRGTFLNLQAGYLKTNLDDRGSEFRALVQLGDNLGIFSDVYKYLDDGQRWYLNPQLLLQRRDLFVYDADGRARASLRINDFGGAIFAGREFSRFATLSFGLQRYTGEIKVQVGEPLVPEEYDAGEWLLTATYDRLDDLYLPTRGARSQLTYLSSEQSLGADTDFSQVLFSGVGSKSWGPHNMLLSLRYNVTVDGDAPTYALFTGGGFLNMSGFEPTSLIGSNFGVAAAGYRYEVIQSGFLPGYVGGTVEYGNTAAEQSDVFTDGILNGSLYFAYDTPLGPLYLGWGWNTERRGVIFLRLGAILGGNDIGRR